MTIIMYARQSTYALFAIFLLHELPLQNVMGMLLQRNLKVFFSIYEKCISSATAVLQGHVEKTFLKILALVRIIAIMEPLIKFHSHFFLLPFTPPYRNQIIHFTQHNHLFHFHIA